MSFPAPESSLDRRLALSRVGGDMELLREIAALFLEECPRSLLEIHQAVTGEDAAKLENAAHSLKGSVANFGRRRRRLPSGTDGTRPATGRSAGSPARAGTSLDDRLRRAFRVIAASRTRHLLSSNFTPTNVAPC